ncbi:MAG: cyclic nucleotide-binding domain-containing protein [Planctomycetota bacterium]|nr:cyclic nucleotide-binding domain-containing protein [Planctomycetota bacterium]
MRTLEPTLAEHPFFRDLAEDYIRLCAGCAKNVVFKPGQYLLREGHKADQFFVLRAGRVQLQMEAPGREPLTIQSFSEGDVIGWSWLVPPYRWAFDAKAVEATRCLALDGACLRKKCEANHDLGYELFKRIAAMMERRLHATRLQILDVYAAPGR